MLDTPIEYLKGVGPDRATVLKSELGITTFAGLLHHFPFRYVDRTRFQKINQVKLDMPFVQVKGRIDYIEMTGGKGKVPKRLVAEFSDDTGNIELVWFGGIRWIRTMLKENMEYVVFGRPNLFNGQISISHPELDPVSDDSKGTVSPLQPVYSSTEKLSSRWLNSKGIQKLQQQLLQKLKSHLAEFLPDAIISKLCLLPREKALFNIHFPENPELLQRAQKRLKFEELFLIQLDLLRMKAEREQVIKGIVFSRVGDFVNHFYKEKLPFQFTEAQKRVIKEIRRDLGSGKQMNRLLQGDVGSGKTIVALMSSLIALDNGYQSALMAPTEILANQHYNTISIMVEGLGINVGLLTGSTRAKERKLLGERLINGELHILIGTHALIEDNVQFNKLGLAIIDEQQRFGVAQRSKLTNRDPQPHVLVMTATPIPRTLALTLYGDLDTSTINELPPNRKPVQTVHRFDSGRLQVFGFLREQIKKGRQVYIVYPLIEESEKMDYKDLMDGYESICQAFPEPEYHVGVVHGRMKSKERDYVMQRFKAKDMNILVATTVIEVGVDVSNASVMVVESAERFGLSQLHQLRGRVGRGAENSYCILMTGNKLSEEAKTRLEKLVRTNDGFEIAEADMQLRGHGDLMGTQQSGIVPLKIADLVKDGEILQVARQAASELLGNDPFLMKPENLHLSQYLTQRKKEKSDWSRVS